MNFTEKLGWQNWESDAWANFWRTGTAIPEAMADLETRKLSGG